MIEKQKCSQHVPCEGSRARETSARGTRRRALRCIFGRTARLAARQRNLFDAAMEAQGARFLLLDDPYELLAAAIGPPWPTSGLETEWREDVVCWLRAHGDEDWIHEHVWVPREDGGEVCIHRFSPRGDMAQLISGLEDHVMAELAPQLGPGRNGESASTVGGHHSERDVWSLPVFAQTRLPELISAAVGMAASLEADAVGREVPLSLCATPEAWWNALPPGGWNTLHVHPGCAYACTLFVRGIGSQSSGASGCDGDDGGDGRPRDENDGSGDAETRHGVECRSRSGASMPLAGRLVLLPGAPDTLADHHGAHVRRKPGDGKSDELPSAPPPAPPPAPPTCAATLPAEASSTLESAVSAEHKPSPPPAALRYLAVDPLPGTLLVWPSFVPHFVAPTPHRSPRSAAASGGSGGAAFHDGEHLPRISLACNF